jgi:hypothetical protein
VELSELFPPFHLDGIGSERAGAEEYQSEDDEERDAARTRRMWVPLFDFTGHAPSVSGLGALRGQTSLSQGAVFAPRGQSGLCQVCGTACATRP